MKTLASLAAVAAILGANAAGAQAAYHWPAPEAQGDQGRRYFLEAGKPIPLRTLTPISTKDNKPGDRVYLEVAQNVSFRGQVIIPAGAPVTAEVTRLQRNGHMGRKGKVEIRLMSAETPSGPVLLTGSAYDEGKSGTAASVATMMFVSIVGGFLIHGTSGELPAGTPVQGYLAQDLKFILSPQAEAQAAEYRRIVG